jgi:hypothetical protein
VPPTVRQTPTAPAGWGRFKRYVTIGVTDGDLTGGSPTRYNEIKGPARMVRVMVAW